MLVGDVVRLQRPPESTLDFGDTLGTRHWREGGFEQPMLLEALPISAAGADRHIGVSGPEIAQLIARRHPNGEVGMLHLEAAQRPSEPCVGKRMRRRDREKQLILLAMTGEGRFDRVEGA